MCNCSITKYIEKSSRLPPLLMMDSMEVYYTWLLGGYDGDRVRYE